MAIIQAVITNSARKYWPQYLGGANGNPPAGGSWNPVIQAFRVGEGGFTGTPPVRRTPDPTLRDLDILQNPSRYPTVPSSLNYFEKDFQGFGQDIVFVSPTTIQLNCLLAFTDYNQDGAAQSPVIWEIGLYSAFPSNGILALESSIVYGQTGSLTGQPLLMVAYGTFPAETKTSAVQVENQVIISM